MFELSRRPRPLLKWAGGKKSAVNRLAPLFPKDFQRYLEPFMGGGAVYFALKKQVPALLNDSNPELIHLYQTVREEPIKLMAELERLRSLYSSEFYYELRASATVEPIERAARTIFLNKTGFNGLYRLNKKGTFNVPFGKREKCPPLYDEQNVLEISRLLKRATLFNLDFEEFIDQAQSGDFLYCDPPYEPLSPTSSFKNYTSRGFSRDDQARLKLACAKAAERGATIAISNSASDFIRELYQDWRLETIPMRRSINSKGSARSPVPELLILS